MFFICIIWYWATLPRFINSHHERGCQ